MRAGTATLTGERGGPRREQRCASAENPEFPEPAAGPAPERIAGRPRRGPASPPTPRRGPVPPRGLPRLLGGSARLAAVPRRAALLSAGQRPGSGSVLPPDRGAAGAALHPPAVCGCPATAGPGPPGAAPGRRQLAPGPRLKAQRRLGAEPPPGGAGGRGAENAAGPRVAVRTRGERARVAVREGAEGAPWGRAPCAGLGRRGRGAVPAGRDGSEMEPLRGVVLGRADRPRGAVWGRGPAGTRTLRERRRLPGPPPSRRGGLPGAAGLGAERGLAGGGGGGGSLRFNPPAAGAERRPPKHRRPGPVLLPAVVVVCLDQNSKNP